MAYENLSKVINKHFTEKVTEELLVDYFKFIKEHPGELNCIAEEKDKNGLYEDDTIELCVEYNKEKMDIVVREIISVSSITEISMNLI